MFCLILFAGKREPKGWVIAATERDLMDRLAAPWLEREIANLAAAHFMRADRQAAKTWLREDVLLLRDADPLT